MLLFFIRHGDPTYNPDELTPLGKRQAESLARRIAKYGADEIYVSSSNRAIQTMQPTAEILKKEPVILDWTNESHAYEEQSMPTPDGGRAWGFALPEIKQLLTSSEIRKLGAEWYEHPKFKGTKFAEGHLRIKRQTREFLAQHGYEWDEERGMYKNLNFIPETGSFEYDPTVKKASNRNEKRVVLFAHHGFGTNFLSAVLDIPFPQVCLKMNFGHTGMTVIEFGEKGEYVAPQMLTMANDGHLLADNMPTAYNNSIYF
ncbi:MAG: histidine phosphatase family protein [Lachnospiraceae bacterium]|nr:histidine phosphatase family protein [Lachnospiraceae bacterium]